MLGKDNVIKIGDFGISKVLSSTQSLAMTKFVRTTPLYKSPEGYNKKLRQDKVDIWSAGVILYFMSSNEYPFDTDEEDEDLAREILKQKITQEQHASINGRSNNMNNFITFLLNKNPDQRPTI